MNSFGKLFRISIFGESHGQEVGVLIDGCPAGLILNSKDFLPDLSRRKSGSKGTTPRIESDNPRIKSGLFNNKTTGAPLLISFQNSNIRSKDYDSLLEIPRPGHADFTAMKKYGGHNDHRGGGDRSGIEDLGGVGQEKPRPNSREYSQDKPVFLEERHNLVKAGPSSRPR